MNHSKTIQLRNELLNVKGLKSHEVNYAIDENLERLAGAIKPLEKQEKEIEDKIAEFTEARKELGKKMSTVDDEVKTRKEVVNGRLMEVFDIQDDVLAEYKKQMVELRKKYAKEIEEYEKEIKEYNEFLNESESPYKPYTIKFQHVPADISTEHMRAIFPIIRKKIESE